VIWIGRIDCNAAYDRVGVDAVSIRLESTLAAVGSSALEATNTHSPQTLAQRALRSESVGATM